MDFTKVEFIKSAANRQGFIRVGRQQIGFSGRSNVGKSSIINLLVRRKNFARVGSQPGKTSQINFFLIDKRVYLTDLPGYGYAKVSKAEQASWQKNLEEYLLKRKNLISCIQFIDARHDIQKTDFQMNEWRTLNSVPNFSILAT